MKAYSVLIKQNNSKKIEDIKIVKEGFSLGVFLFSGLWFLYHKMFKEFAVLIVVTVILQSFTALASDFDKTAIEMFFLIMIALNANYWLVQHLKRKSYDFVGMTFANNCDEARNDVVKNLDDEVFAEKYLNPRLDKKPNFLKKILRHFS
jgi:hypothetical protein